MQIWDTKETANDLVNTVYDWKRKRKYNQNIKESLSNQSLRFQAGCDNISKSKLKRRKKKKKHKRNEITN